MHLGSFLMNSVYDNGHSAWNFHGRMAGDVRYRTTAAKCAGIQGWERMDERIDRRAARTRKALHHALMSLILRKGYEATTIQDIIDEADVGRSTFYGHYTSKEDLLRSGFQMLRSELVDAQRAARTGGSRYEPLGFSLAMFEHASRYTDVYRALVGGRGGIVAVNELRKVLAEFVRKDLSAARDDSTVSRELAAQFVVGAFMSVLTWWLEHRSTLKPTHVDAMFRRLVVGGIGPSGRANVRAG
jgi:AcrR family transcriptional regulator